MESEQVLQLAEELEAEEESAESLLREWMQDSPAPAGEETTCNGRVVAWTDGAQHLSPIGTVVAQPC